MTAPIDIICSHCGSHAVRRDAFAVWNSASQAWELLTVFDQGYCENCGGEQRLAEVPLVTPDFQKKAGRDC